MAARDCSLRYSRGNGRRVSLSDVGTATESQTEFEREGLIRHLRELISALDGRMPHLERTGETQIADDAKALRTKALHRIAELDRKR